MKAIITETMTYEIELQGLSEMAELQHSEDMGYGGIADAINTSRAKLQAIDRKIYSAGPTS
jgi:hypothetical protein